MLFETNMTRDLLEYLFREHCGLKPEYAKTASERTDEQLMFEVSYAVHKGLFTLPEGCYIRDVYPVSDKVPSFPDDDEVDTSIPELTHDYSNDTVTDEQALGTCITDMYGDFEAMLQASAPSKPDIVEINPKPETEPEQHSNEVLVPFKDFLPHGFDDPRCDAYYARERELKRLESESLNRQRQAEIDWERSTNEWIKDDYIYKYRDVDFSDGVMDYPDFDTFKDAPEPPEPYGVFSNYGEARESDDDCKEPQASGCVRSLGIDGFTTEPMGTKRLLQILKSCKKNIAGTKKWKLRKLEHYSEADIEYINEGHPFYQRIFQRFNNQGQCITESDKKPKFARVRLGLDIKAGEFDPECNLAPYNYMIIVWGDRELQALCKKRRKACDFYCKVIMQGICQPTLYYNTDAYYACHKLFQRVKMRHVDFSIDVRRRDYGEKCNWVMKRASKRLQKGLRVIFNTPTQAIVSRGTEMEKDGFYLNSSDLRAPFKTLRVYDKWRRQVMHKYQRDIVDDAKGWWRLELVANVHGAVLGKNPELLEQISQKYIEMLNACRVMSGTIIKNRDQNYFKAQMAAFKDEAIARSTIAMPLPTLFIRIPRAKHFGAGGLGNAITYKYKSLENYNILISEFKAQDERHKLQGGYHGRYGVA